MSKKRAKKRVYRLSDLQAMVEQLGGRLHVSIVPKEFVMSQPQVGAQRTRLCTVCGNEVGLGHKCPGSKDRP